jgi:hypothetical protein
MWSSIRQFASSARSAKALLISAEIHAIGLVVPWPLHRPARPAHEENAQPTVLVDVALEPHTVADVPGDGGGRRVPSSPVRPGQPPPPAARAAPVVATTTPQAEPAVADHAASFPGGTTQLDAWWPAPQDDPLARAWGVLDGAGTGAGGRRSRAEPARLGGPKRWPCTLPFGVDFDHAVAQVVADVDASGRAVDVAVIDDPHRLAGVAMPCAMREHYVAARDASGRPTRGRTAPFRIVFEKP